MKSAVYSRGHKAVSRSSGAGKPVGKGVDGGGSARSEGGV